MRLRTLAWWHEVCNQSELVDLRRRNEKRLAALKAVNSLIENERTRAYQSPAESAAARLAPYFDLSNDRSRFDPAAMVNSQ